MESVLSDDDKIIEQALSILEERSKYESSFFCTSDDSLSQFLRLKMGDRDREVFAVLFLTTRHRLIEYDELFLGTINKTNVHVREIVRKALLLNASAIVLAHNHPSGDSEPSNADLAITNEIKSAVSVFDIRLLDHLVVTGTSYVSFCARGLI